MEPSALHTLNSHEGGLIGRTARRYTAQGREGVALADTLLPDESDDDFVQVAAGLAASRRRAAGSRIVESRGALSSPQGIYALARNGLKRHREMQRGKRDERRMHTGDARGCGGKSKEEISAAFQIADVSGRQATRVSAPAIVPHPSASPSEFDDMRQTVDPRELASESLRLRLLIPSVITLHLRLNFTPYNAQYLPAHLPEPPSSLAVESSDAGRLVDCWVADHLAELFSAFSGH
ncbi:hypothetical protein C8J57DRAFT_1254091 [Mycena rebaudengoi]|nr:hypothetical protein C8J57DRAFT_1254091 [Mycena rebaudengoi]